MCEKVKFRFGPPHGIRRGKEDPGFLLSLELARSPPPTSAVSKNNNNGYLPGVFV
jgi:hypothetical protein